MTDLVRVWGTVSIVAIHSEPMPVNLYNMFARELNMQGVTPHFTHFAVLPEPFLKAVKQERLQRKIQEKRSKGYQELDLHVPQASPAPISVNAAPAVVLPPKVERLLDMIKNAQGQLKDVLAAEKELATWRGKIEKLTGEMRYYDALVSLSTLNVSLTERDIRTAAAATENEQADLGVETDDVEKARADATKAIEDAGGRIVES